MNKKWKIILDLGINVFLLALVILGTTLLKATADNSDMVGFLNDYEKKIIDASMFFFVFGIIIAILLGLSIGLQFLPKLTNMNKILSIFIAGIIAIPFTGIFVALCKNNGLQITILVFLLIIYFGNICYQVYTLVNLGKSIDGGKAESYFHGLDN